MNPTHTVAITQLKSQEKEIANQMNLGAEFSNAYFNPETGEICRIHEFSEGDFPVAQHFIMLPTVTSQDTYLWMVDFTDSVQDPYLRKQLKTALQGIGSFWKFRNVLYHQPEEMQRWQKFNQEKLLAFAREWLQDIEKRSSFTKGEKTFSSSKHSGES